MRKLSATIGAAVLLVVLGALVFLAIWDIPAPSSKVEKVIPNERFQR